jgi:hypothetical protein
MVATISTAVGCASTARMSGGPWDIARAEILEWQPDDPRFGQDFAVETSGLATSGRFLWAPSEKYACVLVLDPQNGLRTRVIDLQVPPHAELEGLAWHDGAIFLVDEAHAAAYRVEVGDERALVDGESTPALVAVPLPLDDLEVNPGKIGFEGVQVEPDGTALIVLLERSGDQSTGCVSRIWRLHMEGERLTVDGESLDLELEDCTWRFTALAWLDGRLIGLKTQFPGERYQVVEIDRSTGDTAVIQDLTEYLRSVRSAGWGNNVEGMAIDGDGALWLIGDNAETGVIDDPYPPPTAEKALLVRIPKRSD